MKLKVKEYEFKGLVDIKEHKNKSKMSNIEYSDLEMQTYLLNFPSIIAKTIMRFRLRMSKFSDNFKRNEAIALCPLCGLHDDSQNLAFECSVVKNNLGVNYSYRDIFGTEIPERLGKLLVDIENMRKKVS